MVPGDTRNSNDGEVRRGGPPVVSCRNVSFSYPGSEGDALSDISFDVHSGEYVGVVGPNGGGKSTLVRLLNGLLKPEQGEVRVLGLDPATEPFEVRKRVGMLFQNPDNGLVSPFVEDDVAFGLENLGVGREEMKGRVGEAVRAVGLGGYERRETHTLSGGEKQRVALAGLLAVEPDLLLLDEPTSMLDAAGRGAVLEKLESLRGKKTVLHVTHHLEELFDADRVLVLGDGKLASDLPPERLFSDGDLMRQNRLVAPPLLRLAQAMEVPPRRSAEDLANEVLHASLRSCSLPAVARGESVAVRFASGSAHSRRESGKDRWRDPPPSSPPPELDESPSGRKVEVPGGEEVGSVPTPDSLLPTPGSDRRERPERSELRDVHHVYSPGTDFEFEALRGVSLSVGPDEVLGVVGGTGSGKSTLVMHMNLLLEPTSGEVLVDGADARSVKKDELRRKVGLVFQFPEAALFAPSVEEDVAFAPGRLGLDEGEVRRRVGEVLDLLGVSHLARRSPHALSGGEKRRVAIAGVMAMGPEVLVLDEPTAGLDPAARDELLDVVRGLRESGMSVVLVSHDLDEVAEVADRVCLMERGEIKALGRPEDVFYSHLENAPDTVRVAAKVGEGVAGVGRPVRFEETVAALKRVAGR